MNTEQFNSIIRSLLKIGGAALVAHGYAADASLLNLPGVAGVVCTIAGLLWSHFTHDSLDASNSTGGGARAALFLAAGLLCFAGCTLDHPQGKILSVTTRGLYVSVSSTDSTTGTPQVKLGLGSQTVVISPADTNKLFAADFANSAILDQTVNPFSTSGSESIASGQYQINQTNATSATQPIVPK